MGQDKFQVIYLTGAPATGKSTLLNALASRLSPLEPFSYSKELAEYLNRRDEASLTQDDMRRQSAQVITPEDVNEVDRLLVQLVSDRREVSHVVIDSHPVTKESYGFRVTAFRQEQLDAIRPTMIVVLYADPEVVIDRISRNDQGRPRPSQYEAAFHNELQGSVALIYGLRLGIPVYFLDSNQPVDKLVEQIVKRTAR